MSYVKPLNILFITKDNVEKSKEVFVAFQEELLAENILKEIDAYADDGTFRLVFDDRAAVPKELKFEKSRPNTATLDSIKKAKEDKLKEDEAISKAEEERVKAQETLEAEQVAKRQADINAIINASNAEEPAPVVGG